MNLLLLFDEDLSSEKHARLSGRRLRHAREILGMEPGDSISVGLAGGGIGKATITHLDDDSMDLELGELDSPPPPPLPVTLVLALPRPRVLHRLIATVTTMGVKRLYLINTWRVEKSYWGSPVLQEEQIRENVTLGLEQARDTALPEIQMRRLFRPFVEEELAEVAEGTDRFVAHPYASQPSPRELARPITLFVGPEGGFLDQEIDSLVERGFLPVHLGSRILRVETAVVALLGRLL